MCLLLSFVFTEGLFQVTQVTKVNGRQLFNPVSENCRELVFSRTMLLKQSHTINNNMVAIKDKARSTVEASAVNQSHGLAGNKSSRE